MSKEMTSDDFILPPNISILLSYEKLLQRKKELLEKQSVILEEYNKLKEKEKLLCNSLGENVQCIAFNYVPSITQIDTLKQQINNLNVIKVIFYY